MSRHEFLIGKAGTNEILHRLTTQQSPKDAILSFQESYGLSESIAGSGIHAIKILNLLGISRAEAVSGILEVLRQKLLEKIQLLSVEKLDGLLEKTYPYIGFEELRKIPLAIMCRHPSISQPLIKSLRDQQLCEFGMPIQVLHQIWNYDLDTFYKAISPWIKIYVLERLSSWSLEGCHGCWNHSFSNTDTYTESVYKNCSVETSINQPVSHAHASLLLRNASTPTVAIPFPEVSPNPASLKPHLYESLFSHLLYTIPTLLLENPSPRTACLWKAQQELIKSASTKAKTTLAECLQPNASAPPFSSPAMSPSYKNGLRRAEPTHPLLCSMADRASDLPLNVFLDYIGENNSLYKETLGLIKKCCLDGFEMLSSIERTFRESRGVDQASDKSSGKKRQHLLSEPSNIKRLELMNWHELATNDDANCSSHLQPPECNFSKIDSVESVLCFSHLKLKSSSNNNSGAVEHLGPDASEKPVPDPCALFDIFMPYALCGAMASLRFDLIMSQHDQNHIAICEEDLVYKFCWCLGVCMKDRHFGDRHLDEMESIVRSIQIKLVEPIKASALKAKEVDADKSKEAKRLIRLRKNSKSSLEEDSEEDGLLGEVSQLEKSNRLRENRARPGAPSNDADENEKSVLSSDANVVETRAKRYFRAGAEEGAERRRIKKSSDGTAEDSDEYDYEGDMNNDDRFAWEDEDDMEYSRSKKRFSSSNRGVQSNQKASEESSTTFTVSPGIRLKKGNQVIFDAANSTFSLEQKLGFKIPPLTREMTRHAELLENISFVLRANYVHVALLDGVISAAQEHTKSLVQRNRKVLTHKESSSTPTRPHRSYSLVDLDTQYEDLPITRKQIYSSLSGNKKLMHLLSLLELSNHPQQLSGLTNLVPWMIRQELPPKVSDAALVSEFLVSFGHLMIELDRWTYAKENEEKKNKQLRLLMQQEAENKQRNADVFMEVLGMMESTERRELEAESEKRIKAAKIEETKSFDEKSFEETAEKLEKDLILPFDYSSHFDSLFTHVDTIQHPNVPFSITLHWILSKMSILDECTIIEFVKWLVYNPPPSDSLNPRLHLLSKYPEFVQQLLRQLSLYAPPKLQTVRQLLFESILLPLASQSPFVHLQILLYLHAAKTRYTISIKDCISLVHALATSHAFSAHFRVQEIRRAYFLLAQLLGSYCHTHQQRTCLAYTFHFLEPTFDLSPHLSP